MSEQFPMKVITLTPPWSWLAAAGLKGYETRSWATSYRGPIGIHTGVNLAPVGGERGLQKLCAQEPFRSALASIGITNPLTVQRGYIIAVANLIEIVTTEYIASQLSARELAFGDYRPGRLAWRLLAAHRLTKPIYAKGKQGIWNYSPEHASAERGST